MMIVSFGVTEAKWMDATRRSATEGEPDPADFAISETPAMIGPALGVVDDR